MDKYYKDITSLINNKKLTMIYLLLFILGSILVIVSKIIEFRIDIISNKTLEEEQVPHRHYGSFKY